MILRPYQQDIITKIKEKLVQGQKRILTVAPTGSGKTVMFSNIAKGAVLKENKVLVISHRIELLNQAGGTFEEFGITPQIITSKIKSPPIGNIFCAMTKTLENRITKQSIWLDWWNEIDIIIIDEAHRGEFDWVLPYESNKTKLGFTATAQRSGKMRQLADEYDIMVNEVDVQQLINLGYLVSDKYYSNPINLKGVEKDSGGDFNKSQMYDKFGTTEIYSGLVDNIKRIAPDEISIVFCCNIKHTIETCVMLNKAGLSAKFVVSQPSKPNPPTDNNEARLTLYKRKLDAYEYYRKYYDIFSGNREDVIADWKSGTFNYLCNAGIFVEGFDHRQTQSIILNVATTSDNKFLQMVGRGARIFFEKRYFKILDFGGNADRLSHYRAERTYSLEHKSSDGDGVAAHKTCPKCKALVISSSQYCKYCGHMFDRKKELEEVELKLREEMEKVKVIYDHPYEKVAVEKGYRMSWAWRKIWHDEGISGLKKYAKIKNYSPKWANMMNYKYRR